jgi:hypothetical protein
MDRKKLNLWVNGIEDLAKKLSLKWPPIIYDMDTGEQHEAFYGVFDPADTRKPHPLGWG